MSSVLGIDQSLSKCACTFVVDGEVQFKLLLRTGNTHTKTKNKKAIYFPLTCDQIKYICSSIEALCLEHKPDTVNLEGLAFGAFGDQKANLSVLLKDIEKTLTDIEQPYKLITPTQLKNFARSLLPEDQQCARDTMNRPIPLKGGKHKLKKMEKKDMVAVVVSLLGESYFEGYTMSTGKDDLADSYLLTLYKTK